MGFFTDLEYRIKWRGQQVSHDTEGDSVSSNTNFANYFRSAYDNIEVVRRGVDLVVDSGAEIDVSITAPIAAVEQQNRGKRLRSKTLQTLLNFRPNPYEDINTFRRELLMDYILYGNSYQYFDAETTSVFHLRAEFMKVETGTRDIIIGYTYNEKTKYKPDEIIHTRDNHAFSEYVGESRLLSCKHSIKTLKSMLDFQQNFFDNGAIPGLIIQTPNILGDKVKQKLLAAWEQRYNPRRGGKRPIILDGDLKVNPISQSKFSDLDFASGVDAHELKILKAIGVPPILLDSGNNANIRPNLQLFYQTTVLPIMSKFISSYERFFGYDMEPDVIKVKALQPEMQEAATYFQGLVNTGIMTINEARSELRLEASTEEHADLLRIPANIAGSAGNPSEGGRPEESEDSNEDPANSENQSNNDEE